MLDQRHRSFLTLCNVKSFTKAAEHLHISQPAVSQHIQFLEEHYGCLLFKRDRRNLELTPQGEALLRFTMRIAADTHHLHNTLEKLSEKEEHFSFGATLSIGEYIMPPILAKFIANHPERSFSMKVNNTQNLLEDLKHGELDFLLVEGLFDQTNYETRCFSNEAFIGICSHDSDLAHGEYSIQDLMAERLIIREPGSGTREIFEGILEQKNYSIQSFVHFIEIGNMAAIKELVRRNSGISFVFEAAAKRDLAQGTLQRIQIKDFAEQRPFTFVSLPHSYFLEDYLAIFEEFKEQYKGGNNDHRSPL